MFRSLAFVGVASAAIIESRPHEHLQMANAQLQNATEAVIKTAAVAGLAYAGAYMAAAGTTPGAYDSSRRSSASSTGQRFCNTRENDPEKYHCTAEYFNGAKVDNAASPQEKVAIRNYWCCPAADLGGQYIGDLNGVCGFANLGISNFAAVEEKDRLYGSYFASGCVYQGPCGESIVSTSSLGQCDGNDGQWYSTMDNGIFGGRYKGAVHEFGPSKLANNVQGKFCCVQDGNTATFASKPTHLNQPVSFCVSTSGTCPSGYTQADENDKERAENEGEKEVEKKGEKKEDVLKNDAMDGGQEKNNDA